jgi:hypothetical protein
MGYANLTDREIGTMFLSSKEKDDTLKKLRLEVERLQEERDDLANNGAGTVSQAFGADGPTQLMFRVQQTVPTMRRKGVD